ncbi:recombination-associated protein RdgC [Rahnella victoriana]|uniref:Recombination-associated protein RdgC n=2 Tax=Rahnella victoriana TaxID=1510570 RepID=A0ABS0DPN5_9GAMM|nr:recombination-associated protein RdgC [Rahnella victoriana]
MSRDIALDAEEMQRQLSSFIFSPCGSQDMAKTGWVSPMGKFGTEKLIHSAGHQLLICAKREEKILPAQVIKQELQDKIDKLQNEQHRKLKKTEKDSLKDEVLHTLMPRAFSRISQTFMWIDLDNRLIMVAAVSTKKAEDLLALLRKSLGSLPVVPLTMETPIELTLTDWVRTGEPPAGFALQDEAELKAILEEGGTIRCKKQALVSDEISSHIENGKLVTQVSMDWQERVSFQINDAFTLKKLKPSGTLADQNDDIDREDFAARFDADFILVTSEYSALISNLISALGGEAQR